MNKVLLFIILVFSFNLNAQNRYIVYFDSKESKDIAQYISNPELILSKEAVLKRQRNNIVVDYYDLPISKKHLNLLQNNDCEIIKTSKWLNAALIECDMSIAELKKLSPNFTHVKKLQTQLKSTLTEEKLGLSNIIKTGMDKNSGKSTRKISIDYGLATIQNKLIDIDYLHDKGYTGKGVTIAILDVGFIAADTSAFFDTVLNNNRIKNTYDFWDDTSYVFHKDDHGTYVFSIIAANKSGVFVGTAPNANFLLAITDDLYSETHQDEFNWITAMEWADSIGVDIISSSVSYSVFDSAEGDYTFEDLDGNTTIIARGADIAASKGIIVVNSGGNGGNITTPCDADSILCVGGADSLKKYDEISSTGPSYDGRIKPDVAALSIIVWGVRKEGLKVLFYGGTSGSTPMIAGLAACLKEAHPNKTNMEIINAIKQSGHQFNNPDTLIGYGIPNARIADSLLTHSSGISQIKSLEKYNIYPNPFKESVTIKLSDLASNEKMYQIRLYSIVGQLISSHKVNDGIFTLDGKDLKKGIYLLEIVDPQYIINITKLIKN